MWTRARAADSLIRTFKPAEAQSVVTQAANYARSGTPTRVLIVGHADTSGAAPANLKLSQERAQSVAAIFRLSGLQRDRLMLRGMGDLMPRAAALGAIGLAPLGEVAALAATASDQPLPEVTSA